MSLVHFLENSELNATDKDTRSFFISIAYLHLEAKKNKMKKTEKCLRNALKAVLSDIKDKALLQEIKIMFVIIEKATALGEKDLNSLLKLVDWLEEQDHETASIQ